MRSNKKGEQNPCHIVSAWSKGDGYCLGQKVVEVKSNEVKAMPEVLENIQIKGQVITTDAMGTQTAIVEKIRGKRADYVLTLKANQGTLYEDVQLYFEDSTVPRDLRKRGNYKKTEEKAHGQYERREYHQTEDVKWLPQKEKWKGLNSIGME